MIKMQSLYPRTSFSNKKSRNLKKAISFTLKHPNRSPCPVHVPNFFFWGGGVAGSEDFACATLPTTPLDFQGNLNFLSPYPPKNRI